MPATNTTIYRDDTLNGDQLSDYSTMRTAAQSLAAAIEGTCPESRERALAITHLEQALMWARAALTAPVGTPGPPVQTGTDVGDAYGDGFGAVS